MKKGTPKRKKLITANPSNNDTRATILSSKGYRRPPSAHDAGRKKKQKKKAQISLNEEEIIDNEDDIDINDSQSSIKDYENTTLVLKS